MSRVMRVLTAALTVGSLASCGTQRDGLGIGATKKIVPAVIFITPTGIESPKCAATASPYSIQVKKNEDVEWGVVDFCGITVGYTKDFELRWKETNKACQDGSKSPLEAPASGKLHAKRKVNQSCSAGMVFEYEIWVDGVKLADPELEIAM